MRNGQISRLSRDAINEYAEKIAEHHNVFSSTSAADLDRLLAALGGRLEQSYSVSAAEALTVRDRGHFVVHIPPMTSARRDRFTIAHELGHYFLHYLQPGKSGAAEFGRGERNSAETQANYFAAGLLMPTNRFKSAFREHQGATWRIADVFQVSPRAVEVRAQYLGLV